MKHILFLLTFCILFACDNATENSRLKVGKTTVSSNDKPVSKNEFTYGEAINISFKNVTGLTKFEGKVFPVATIYLLNEKKDTVEINNYNFGAQFITDEPLNLDINFLAVLTKASNKKSELKIKIEDTKGEGFFDYSMPFSINPNDNFFVKPDGISYSNIYLFNKINGGVITNNVIGPNDELVIMYEGLTGFKQDNIGFIYPAAAAKIVDADGTVLLDENNLLESNEVLGFKNAEISIVLPVEIAFDKTSKKNPLKLSLELFDLKSNNKLVLETTLTLK